MEIERGYYNGEKRNFESLFLTCKLLTSKQNNANIISSDANGGMEMKKLSLHDLRKKAGFTLEEVSQKSGVPYSTVRALEIGMGKGFSLNIKRKIADVFHVEVLKLFPEEMEKIQGLMEELKSKKEIRSHRFDTLKDFLPDLHFKNESAVSVTLDSMSLDELGDLFHSGLTKKEALEHLKKAAKKYGLPMPEIR